MMFMAFGFITVFLMIICLLNTYPLIDNNKKVEILISYKLSCSQYLEKINNSSAHINIAKYR